MSILGELNKLADESYGDLQAKGEVELNRQQHQGYNPFDDLGNAVTEWIDGMTKAGQKLAVTAGEAYQAGDFSAIDDMSLPSPDYSEASPAQEKVAVALQDAVDDARYAATKDPISIAGDLAGAVNPWIPLAVQVPIMVKDGTTG